MTPLASTCSWAVVATIHALSGQDRAASGPGTPFDLIILDVMLPDLDGLEVTRRLRSAGLRVPVLFLTARDSVEDRIAGLTVGGDDHVIQPFALGEVVARRFLRTYCAPVQVRGYFRGRGGI